MSGPMNATTFDQKLLWSILEHLKSLNSDAVKDAAALNDAIAALEKATGLSLQDEQARSKLGLVSKK